jgi:transcriptional regulator with XRE-family HTH domain
MMRKSTHTQEYQIFLKLLIEERAKAGLTQAQLGTRLTFGQPGISKIERAERRVDIVELHLICNELEIDLVDFVIEFRRRLDDSSK